MAGKQFNESKVPVYVCVTAHGRTVLGYTFDNLRQAVKDGVISLDVGAQPGTTYLNGVTQIQELPEHWEGRKSQ